MGSETNVGRGQTDLAATPVTGRLGHRLFFDDIRLFRTAVNP